MTVGYVYRGQVIANGRVDIIPQKGEFVELQANGGIYEVKTIMHKVFLNGDVAAIIYLCDVSIETEKMLRNYK